MKVKEKQVKENKEVVELKNQLVRALADYDNLRKRAEMEKTVWEKFSGEKILIQLIPVLDTFINAQKHLKDKGLELAIANFVKILNNEGLIEINPKLGDMFDHNTQDAIESIPGGKNGQIMETLLSGWKYIDGHVVRFAKVKVYQGEKEENKK
jgi:molecular chaperone GrpE